MKIKRTYELPITIEFTSDFLTKSMKICGVPISDTAMIAVEEWLLKECETSLSEEAYEEAQEIKNNDEMDKAADVLFWKNAS